MAKKLITKNILLGFLSWVIPFVVSFFFVRPGGEYIIPYASFKCIITIVGTFSGCLLLFRYFKSVDREFVKNGIIVGFSWFIINVLFDSIILIPMMKSSFLNYFMTIGLGYISIPIISITMGYLLERKIKQK